MNCESCNKREAVCRVDFPRQNDQPTKGGPLCFNCASGALSFCLRSITVGLPVKTVVLSALDGREVAPKTPEEMLLTVLDALLGDRP